MADLELSPPVFSILSALIEDRLGIHYGIPDRPLLQEKVSARAVEAGFESLLDYYYFLRYDPGSDAELKELTEALVVNETYFFREWPAIEAIVDSIITPLCAAGRGVPGHRVRVWSAACATGEEPLSLAMLLDDRGMLSQVDILATDISERVLAKARSGRFGKRSIRHVPLRRLQDRYIQPQPNGHSVDPRLVEAIRWRQVNLLHQGLPEEVGQFDVILCRNVLIYFADATVNAVLERLSVALRPSGVLVVGVSESLMRYGSGLVGEEHAGAFLYRKAST